MGPTLAQIRMELVHVQPDFCIRVQANFLARYSQPITIDADLELTSTPSDNNPPKGSTFEYELVVTNFGPADAYQVTLYDQLPAGVELTNNNPVNCSENGGLVTCLVGNLDNEHLVRGHLRVIRLNMMVTQDDVDVTTNQAWVCTISPDPNPDNNDPGPCYRLSLPLVLR